MHQSFPWRCQPLSDRQQIGAARGIGNLLATRDLGSDQRSHDEPGPIRKMDCRRPAEAGVVRFRQEESGRRAHNLKTVPARACGFESHALREYRLPCNLRGMLDAGRPPRRPLAGEHGAHRGCWSRSDNLDCSRVSEGRCEPRTRTTRPHRRVLELDRVAAHPPRYQPAPSLTPYMSGSSGAPDRCGHRRGRS
jgi:hypothetical protein